MGMSKGEAVEKLGIANRIDYALPQDLVDDIQKVTGVNPVPHMVYCYGYTDTKGETHRLNFGLAYPLTKEGKELLKRYYVHRDMKTLLGRLFNMKTIDDLESFADRLPDRIKSKILYALTNAGEIPEEDVIESINHSTPTDVLDKWLTHEGIIGYTSEIVETLDALREAYKK